MIDIILLGTGAMTPLPGRHLSSMLLRHEGRQILVDCGEGTQVAIRKHAAGLKTIDGIALTHFHGDHFFGLPGLLQSIGHAGRTQEVWVAGPEGLEEMMAHVRGMSGNLPFDVKLVKEGRFWSGSLLVETFPLLHRVPTQGYRFTRRRPGRFYPDKAKALGVSREDWSRLQAGEVIGHVTPQMVLGPQRKGISVAYVADSRPDASIAEAVSGVDLLIIEGTYPGKEKESQAVSYAHMTFLEAAALAKEAGVKEAWLTHYSPAIEDPEEHLFDAQKIFSSIHCGTDGKKTTLRFEKE